MKRLMNRSVLFYWLQAFISYELFPLTDKVELILRIKAKSFLIPGGLHYAEGSVLHMDVPNIIHR